ncbi:MarR family winged helix-turn-helix transcriptional regulator [Catenulispora subtropica]
MSEAPDLPDIPEIAMRASLETWVMFGRLRRRLQALPGESGLSPAQTSVLVRLGKVDAASAGALAAAEQVSHQAMAKTVAGLEALGLIVRRPDPVDRRRWLLALTEAGRARSQGERHARQQWLARALAEHGTPEQIEAVITAMALLGEVADA